MAFLVLLLSAEFRRPALAEYRRLDQVRKLADGILLKKETRYNNIEVHKSGATITMYFKTKGVLYAESSINLDRPEEIIFGYGRLLQASFLYAENLGDMVMLGFGCGDVARYCRRYIPGMVFHGVDIDSGVLDVARAYFLIEESPGLFLYEQDARAFLATRGRKYDIIMADTYRGGYIPYHLTTQEYFRTIRSRLRPGGCLAAHLHHGEILQNLLATLKTVFKNCDVYPVPDAGSSIIIAFDGPRPAREALKARAAELQKRHAFRYDIRETALRRETSASEEGGKVLKDGFRPQDQDKYLELYNRKKN